MILEAIAEQIIQSISSAIWNRPELLQLREPIELALNGNDFLTLTLRALRSFEENARDLPHFFDPELISSPRTQRYLAEYIVNGHHDAVVELASDYSKHFDTDFETVRTSLADYLRVLRSKLIAHPIYGPIIISHDIQTTIIGIRNLHDDMQEIKQLLHKTVSVPEVRNFIAGSAGKHIFLSYSRNDGAFALKLRNALEAEGHSVWQDITSILGGAEWIDSIEEGIRGSYTLVTILSYSSARSRWVRLEFLEAQRRGIPIIPLKVDQCEIPLIMLDMNVRTAYPDFDRGIKTILSDLRYLATAQVIPEAVSEENSQLTNKQREMDYLDRLLLEFNVWQALYVPLMASSHAIADSSIISSFRNFLRDAYTEKPDFSEEESNDIIETLKTTRQLVILGNPGSGKSTTLWKLVAEYSLRSKEDNSYPLPVLIKLGTLSPSITLRDQCQKQLGDISFSTLLEQQRIAFFIDGLNELPAENQTAKLSELRDLLKVADLNNLTFVVTCRDVDYEGTLVLDIPLEVMIRPLNPAQIWQFCTNYLPEQGDELFWQLFGEDAVAVQKFFEVWKQEGLGDFKSLWLTDKLPEKIHSVRTEVNVILHLRQALKSNNPSPLLISLASNPYMLFMLCETFAETGNLPINQALLFKLFTSYLLLHREQANRERVEVLWSQLAQVAFLIQSKQLGTSVPRNHIVNILSDEMLSLAVRASVLALGSDQISFTHQLLQEFFAAHQLKAEWLDVKHSYDLFSGSRKDISVWSKTIAFLVGLQDATVDSVIWWVFEANPELATTSLIQSGISIPHGLRTDLERQLLAQLSARSIPSKRASIGRALGEMDDPRVGVGVSINGLPDIVWCEVPEGQFIYQNGDLYRLPTYYISKYPVTYIQFQAFIVDQEGFYNDQWWYELERPSKLDEQTFKYHNHPRESVNWFTATAYCRWLSSKLGYSVQLPSEEEWEKAARGSYGAFYPSGDFFDSAAINSREMRINQTTAVGIFPENSSPFGAMDMCGNVWEWTTSSYIGNHNAKSYPDVLVLRGGSWSNNVEQVNSVVRFGCYPNIKHNDIGFRLSTTFTSIKERWEQG